jgi:hypothetical protein
MNPSVVAAVIAGVVSLISLGGTVVVAVVGFRNSREATTRTVTAGTANTVLVLDAAREERLWEKRTASYEETVAYLLFRQMKRRHELNRYRLGDGAEKLMEGLFGKYKPAGWFEIQGRLVTYASDNIIEAYEAAHFADGRVVERYLAWKQLAAEAEAAIAAGQIGRPQDGTETIAAAARAVELAVKDGEEKDQALIKLIRSELHGRASQALLVPDRAAS